MPAHSPGYNNDAESIRNAMQQAMGGWLEVSCILLFCFLFLCGGWLVGE